MLAKPAILFWCWSFWSRRLFSVWSLHHVQRWPRFIKFSQKSGNQKTIKILAQFQTTWRLYHNYLWNRTRYHHHHHHHHHDAKRSAEAFHSCDLSSASSRASVADRPVSWQIWCTQVVDGRPQVRLHSCEGRSPSLVLVQIGRIGLAGTEQDIVKWKMEMQTATTHEHAYLIWWILVNKRWNNGSEFRPAHRQPSCWALPCILVLETSAGE